MSHNGTRPKVAFEGYDLIHTGFHLPSTANRLAAAAIELNVEAGAEVYLSIDGLDSPSGSRRPWMRYVAIRAVTGVGSWTEIKTRSRELSRYETHNVSKVNQDLLIDRDLKESAGSLKRIDASSSGVIAVGSTFAA